jgi:hypothetical protein
MQLEKISAKAAQVGFTPAPEGFIRGKLIYSCKISTKSAQLCFDKSSPVGFICAQLMQLLK